MEGGGRHRELDTELSIGIQIFLLLSLGTGSSWGQGV